jgi:hypothetical protein
MMEAHMRWNDFFHAQDMRFEFGGLEMSDTHTEHVYLGSTTYKYSQSLPILIILAFTTTPDSPAHGILLEYNKAHLASSKCT